MRQGMITNDEPGFGDDEPPTAGRKPRVLVADDDDDARVLIVTALANDGYEIVEARDGTEALLLMVEQQHMPDAIVTDVRMPSMDGLALLSALRERGWRTPLVVVTAYAAARTQAERFGADVVLAKPFDVEELRTEVMRLLRPNDERYSSAPPSDEDE